MDTNLAFQKDQERQCPENKRRRWAGTEFQVGGGDWLNVKRWNVKFPKHWVVLLGINSHRVGIAGGGTASERARS
jgi:hypothetical protein